MRRVTRLAHRLLTWLMVGTVAILIVPVTLQIVARYTHLIPAYIWTEELSRFLFIWMVMLGAMIGVRERSHFEVDLWPELAPRAAALLRIVSDLLVLAFALVFVWWGVDFLRFGWDQLSELAELPMPWIFAAWPLAGLLWALFLGESLVDSWRVLRGTRAAWASVALTPGMAAAALFGVFFLLLALRVPVAFALGLACLPVVIVEERLSPLMLFNQTFKAYNSFILLAVPFFLLTANLMNIGGITDRLVRLSRTMVGHFPGALAQINVLLSVFFAGISGSSTADAASQSKIFIEAQVKEGYGLSFSIAITAVSAVLAVIIPPSILMIVWGGVISTSIGAMYLAGIVPGLLIAAAQMVTVHVYAKLYRYPVYPRATLREFLYSGWISIPALFTPFIVVGGILLGWFTATESAAVAVIYAAVLSIFVYREMDLRHLYSALADTGRLASVALFCVGTASAFGWLLAYYQIPRALLAHVTSWGLGITGAGFFIAFVFLVVGCFLDAIPAIIIVGTILQPLAHSVHMHPIHFAIIGIVSLAFGLVTPPYGLCLLISCAVAKVPLRFALKDTLIMLLPMLAMLAAIILWPEIPLILPRLVAPDLLPVKLSLNTATVKKQWGLAQAIAGCARHGIAGISPWRDQVAHMGLKNAASSVRSNGLAVTGLCRGGFFTAPDWRDDNRRAIEEAHTLGAQCLVLVVGGPPAGSKDLLAARKTVEDGIAAILPEARAAGVPLAIEPLHPMQAAERACINTLEQALDVCERLGDGVGVAVDVYHVWWDPKLQSQIKRGGKRILAYHICDWLVPTRDLLNDRGMMGDGVIDLPRIRSWVEATGYAGFQEVEIFSEDWWRRDPDEVLRTCVERSRTC